MPHLKWEDVLESIHELIMIMIMMKMVDFHGVCRDDLCTLFCQCITESSMCDEAISPAIDEDDDDDEDDGDGEGN